MYFRAVISDADNGCQENNNSGVIKRSWNVQL